MNQDTSSAATYNETTDSSSSSSSYNITVVGIGAMGGGMARALMDSAVSKTVTGYDQASFLVDAFYTEAQAAGKAPALKPVHLPQAISTDTHFCLIVLQNESQCEQVCFGSNNMRDDDNDNKNQDGRSTTTRTATNLLELLPKGSCVIVSSTVTATWIQRAHQRFAAAGIMLVDSPVSGGPVRARSGELTLMVSASDEYTLQYAKPILDALAQQVYIVQGGVGMGSTVKMVHQLLAGVHIVVAAEALALAAKAGLDVRQVYEIVNGAAGASWMFQDRGQRMMQQQQQQLDPAPCGVDDQVKSQLQIFIKDLDIVHAEAKRLQSPVPLASAALQQYISGQSLGLGKADDSQVVQVYERITGVKVSGSGGGGDEHHQSPDSSNSPKKEGDKVGDYWKLPNGTLEQILEVGDEPRHNIVLSNDFVRALRVSFPPNDTTLAHRHTEDSLYFFLVEGLNVINHIQGSDPACDCMEFGEVRYGTHKMDKPLVHKITNTTDKAMLCIDAEILKRPPVTAAIPLVAEKHELVKTRDKCRVYKLSLEPGESVTGVCYPFFHLSVMLQPGQLEKTIGGRIRWTESSELGEVSWKEPIMDMTKKNVGTSVVAEYIVEWC